MCINQQEQEHVESPSPSERLGGCVSPGGNVALQPVDERFHVFQDVSVAEYTIATLRCYIGEGQRAPQPLNNRTQEAGVISQILNNHPNKCWHEYKPAMLRAFWS